MDGWMDVRTYVGMCICIYAHLSVYTCSCVYIYMGICMCYMEHVWMLQMLAYPGIVSGVYAYWRSSQFVSIRKLQKLAVLGRGSRKSLLNAWDLGLCFQTAVKVWIS